MNEIVLTEGRGYRVIDLSTLGVASSEPDLSHRFKLFGTSLIFAAPLFVLALGHLAGAFPG